MLRNFVLLLLFFCRLGAFEEFPEFDEFHEYEELKFTDAFNPGEEFAEEAFQDELKEPASKFTGDERIVFQESREQLLAYVRDFPVNEYDVVKGKNASFYVQKGDNFQENSAIDILFERHLKAGSTVVDYGAGNGMHTLTLSRLVGVKGKVIAFEAHLPLFREIFWNLEINKVCNVQLYYSIEKTLDSYHLENIAFIRINGDGREDIFLKGAKETIQKYRPVLIINMIGGIPLEKADKFIKQEFYKRMEAIHRMGYTTQRINEGEYLAIPK